MIDKSNYQTVILEQAIENLTKSQIGKRTQIDEFDVRHELDKLRKDTSVIVGWKVDPNDPSKNNPQFKSAADLWQYSESSIQTILAKVKENYSKDLTRFKFPTKEGGKKELIEIVDSLRQTAFMVKSTDVKKFVLAMLETAEYTQTMDPRHSAQKINILFSPVKGGGKSYFLEHLKDDAEKAGVMTAWGALPSRGDTNDDFHPFMENSLVIAQDAQESSYYEPGIMAIGRKENLQIKEKYGKPYNARMIADVWTSTNNFLRSDRTKNIIECNSFRIEDMNEKFPEKFLRKSGEVTLYNIWSYQFSHFSHFSHLKRWMKDNICIKKVEGENEKMRILKDTPESAVLLSFIEELQNAPVDFNSVSVAKLVKYSETPKSDVNKMRAKLSRIIKNLYSKGIVRHTMDGGVDYEQWDLSELVGLTAEMVFTGEKDNSDIMGEFEKTQKAYYEIIDYIQSLDDDPQPSKDEEETIENKENNMTIGEIMAEEKKEDEMDVFHDECTTRKYMVHVVRKQGKAPKFTHYLQMYVNDRLSQECVLEKKYFLFNDKGEVSNESQSKEFADDMKQIWYSKGRLTSTNDVDITDEEFQRFANRMMKVVNGVEELHITADLVVDNGQIYCSKV